jgi:hypothetical protein
MGSSASAMGAMNAALPIGKMQQQMDAFARESQMAEIKSELVDETLDAMLDVGEEGEEESDRMVAAILDEIGVETQEKVNL